MCTISIENIEETISSLYIVNIEIGKYRYEIQRINIISLFQEGIFLMRENSEKCKNKSDTKEPTKKSPKESIFLLLRLFLSLYRVFSHFHLLQARRGVTLPVFLIEERCESRCDKDQYHQTTEQP